MSSDSESLDEFTESESESGSTSRSYNSGMFAGSQNFTVTGANLTNIIKNYPSVATGPSGIRMIRMEDIVLHRDIRFTDDSCIVRRNQQRGHVRRVHAATVTVDGRESGATVAIYQGRRAGREWRKDIAKYASLRHPNFVQIRGAARLGSTRATLFHHDLLPVAQFLASSRLSPILTVYIYGSWNTEYWEADRYLHQTREDLLHPNNHGIWIHGSSGHLCVDFASSCSQSSLPTDRLRLDLPGLNPLEVSSLEAPNAEIMAIDSLSLTQYHT
ncbi:hypothetical protein C8R47DRAFT_400954 [Mycena vitilis]|nr:hypothetical protein C8R47DRAFT_400954 [Mycena vitilis]